MHASTVDVGIQTRDIVSRTRVAVIKTDTELNSTDISKDVTIMESLAANPVLPPADKERTTSVNTAREVTLAFSLKCVPGRRVVSIGRMQLKGHLRSHRSNHQKKLGWWSIEFRPNCSKVRIDEENSRRTT